jgi:hypothetical protein
MVLHGSGTNLAKKGDREVHRFATEDGVNLVGATE